MNLTDLITQHSKLSGELAQQLRELGDTRNAIANNQAHAWRELANLGVTERREEVRYAVAHLVSESETLLGEVEALRVELANIALCIEHYEEAQ